MPTNCLSYFLSITYLSFIKIILKKLIKRNKNLIISDNVSEYAKPRHCFRHKLSLSDSHILSGLTFNFNKRGLGEENSDTFENIKIHRYFLNRILGVIGCKLFSFFDFFQLFKGRILIPFGGGASLPAEHTGATEPQRSGGMCVGRRGGRRIKGVNCATTKRH